MESSDVVETRGVRNTIGRFFNALPGLLVLVLLAATLIYIVAALLSW